MLKIDHMVPRYHQKNLSISNTYLSSQQSAKNVPEYDKVSNTPLAIHPSYDKSLGTQDR
jgi:hypothetical protein